MILYLLGVLTGLVIAVLHFVIVRAVSRGVADKVIEAASSFIPSPMATIVDTDDPLKNIKL